MYDEWAKVPEDMYPESGYALVCVDRMKPPMEDDFMVEYNTWEDIEDVYLPPNRTSYEYYIYTADGERYDQQMWPPDE